MAKIIALLTFYLLCSTPLSAQTITFCNSLNTEEQCDKGEYLTNCHPGIIFYSQYIR